MSEVDNAELDRMLTQWFTHHCSEGRDRRPGSGRRGVERV